MTDNELKPCPFCGNNDQGMFSIPIDSRYGDRLKYVECMVCHDQGSWAATEEEAIDAWSRRAE